MVNLRVTRHPLLKGDIVDKPKLDLSKDKCHVCGWGLKRDFENRTEKCTTIGCQVKGVNFSIPYIQEKKE